LLLKQTQKARKLALAGLARDSDWCGIQPGPLLDILFNSAWFSHRLKLTYAQASASPSAYAGVAGKGAE